MKMFLFLFLGLTGLFFWMYFEDPFIRVIGLGLLVFSIAIKRKIDKG